MKKYPIVWESNGLWHHKKSKRALTELFKSKAHLLKWHPELTEEVGGRMFCSYVVKV